ncbi:MAG: hypothetical protein GW893_20520 [Armatimonadetes bacterium]|nr:hypothetical protein [Armatimonadota bacterium]
MLGRGARGMIERCRVMSQKTDDPQSVEYYACTEIVLNGLIVWVRRHAVALREAAEEEPDSTRREELQAMANLCDRVPENPATSFREAVQSFHFQHLAVMFENPYGGNGPGRLDYYLWPYLESELTSGKITREAAAEFIGELFIKLHERIGPADGWVEALPVGGRNPDGSSAINPLSHIILEVITELKQTHPSVYVRLHDDAPEDFVDRTVRYLLEGENRAQVYGDDATIAAVHQDGWRWRTPAIGRRGGAWRFPRRDASAICCSLLSTTWRGPLSLSSTEGVCCKRESRPSITPKPLPTMTALRSCTPTLRKSLSVNSASECEGSTSISTAMQSSVRLSCFPA